jgi:hypothetical protein
MDVRPNIAGTYEIKFKVGALPVKKGIGGIRMLYLHNAQFPLSEAHDGNLTAMSTLVHAFSALQALKTAGGERVELRNHTAVEEVLWISPGWISERGLKQNRMWRCGERVAI